MSTVVELQSLRRDIVKKIENERRLLTNYERSYESLRMFKESVVTSQSDFHSVSKQKENLLKQVEAISANCRMAGKYASGMGTTLSGVGVKMVGKTYDELLFSIGKKLSYYLGKIDRCDDKITNWNQQVVCLDDEIEAAKQAEQLALLQQEEETV